MRARRLFYEGLASLLDAGIPVRQAVAQLAEQSSGSYRDSLRHLRSVVEAGRPLADGMEERSGHFARYEIELVRAGETSGTLDRAARAIAASEESSDRVRGKILSSLVYPSFVYHFAAVPLNVIQPHKGGFLVGCILWFIPFWLVVGAAWWLLRSARGGGPAGRFVLAVPVLGGLLRDAALLRWARTFAALEDAGVLPEPCAERAAAATGLFALESALRAPLARLRTGATRTEAFAGTPIPPEMYAALSTGETSGTIAASLRKAADVHESRLSARTDSAVAILPAIATVLAGGVVLYAAMKVLGGYYSIR